MDELSKRAEEIGLKETQYRLSQLSDLERAKVVFEHYVGLADMAKNLIQLIEGHESSLSPTTKSETEKVVATALQVVNALHKDDFGIPLEWNDNPQPGSSVGQSSGD